MQRHMGRDQGQSGGREGAKAAHDPEPFGLWVGESGEAGCIFWVSLGLNNLNNFDGLWMVGPTVIGWFNTGGNIDLVWEFDKGDGGV